MDGNPVEMELHSTSADSKPVEQETQVGLTARQNLNGSPLKAEVAESDTFNSEEEVEKKKPSTLRSLFRLFRYATCFDAILMLMGTFASICHGAAVPVLFLLVGDITDSAFNRAITTGRFLVLINNTQNCSAIVANFFPNETVAGCNFTIVPSTTYSEFLQRCATSVVQCTTDSQFIDEINVSVYIIIGIAVAVFILASFQISLFQTTGERQVQKIRLYYYRALMRQEIGWFDANASGALASRLSEDIEKIQDGTGDNIGLLIRLVSVFIGGLAIGFVREWRLTLLLLGFTPLLAIIGAIQSSLIASFASREQKEYAAAGAVAEEVLSSVRTVVAFGGEYKEVDRYHKNLKLASSNGAKRGLAVGISAGFALFFLYLVTASAFWFGAYLISVELSRGGAIVTVFFATLLGSLALAEATPQFEALVTAAGTAQDIFDTIDRVPEIDSSSDEGLVPGKFESSIRLNKVIFSYPTRPHATVLKELSLDVKVGQTVALVGPSGCGKSTVIQLLQRFYDVEKGDVMVGGYNVSSLNIKWLRRHIGVVSQEPVLFDTTIAENIRYGREDASMEDIEKAAINANAHNFIKDLPSGYDTLVGELGTQLSGGQKQRIAIARALVRDPKLLFLDEATSALDTESESIVQQALDKASEGRTTIVIAHRLSTIQSADVIASIEDGQVVEMGTHSELMAKHGLYYELVSAQTYSHDECFTAQPLERVLTMQKRRTMRRRKTVRRTTIRRENRPTLQHQGSRPSLHRMQSVLGDPTRLVMRRASRMREEQGDSEHKNVSLWRVFKYNRSEWWLIVLGILGAGFHGASWPVFAIIFGEVLDVYSLPVDEVLGEINLWGGLFIVVGTVLAIGVFLKYTCFTISGENLTSRLRLISFKAMLRQEMGWYDDERNATGALTARLAEDTRQVQKATGSGMGLLIQAIVAIVLAILTAFVFNWLLTLIVLGMTPALVLAGVLEVKVLSSHSTKNKKVLEESGKIAVDSISNIQTVAALGIEDAFFEKYTQHTQKPYRSALWNTFVSGFSYAISQSIPYLMYAVVFRFGAFQNIQPNSSIFHNAFNDTFIVFIALVFGVIGASQAGAFAPDYVVAKLSAKRIFALLDHQPIIDSYSEDGAKLESVVGEINTTNTVFSYPTRPDIVVLRGLNISVKPGKTLALVGASGSGKSTVVSLIERFYDIIGGQLTLDGTNISDLNIRWLRSQIGIVSQEPVLFDASIADNVRYGANFRTVSDEEVIEATKAANIHNFIESLPQGYDTNVGAKGTQMSGGQKQRIAIARALVRDPKILLLDEATSALDTESEKVVQEALDKAREGRTSIVIAHRLSTIYNADCIVVISGGRAVEKGTHAELMAKKGIYYKLNRFQAIDAGDLCSTSEERIESISEEPLELQ